MNEQMRAFLLARTQDMTLTRQEREIVLALREPEVLLHDALRMAALMPMLTRGEPSDGDPEAVQWLAYRLQERLEILQAVMTKPAEAA
ncbi:hypothetical protein AAC691_12960 [Nguyenibacter vanlangensis]|uniref:Uncharacterized protein n=1 Tax=Nguyenibacter vanlangensis TaxID=1216886 RepID=A0ABZ3D0K3_9PROT